jgi:hypothetical protein
MPEDEEYITPNVRDLVLNMLDQIFEDVLQNRQRRRRPLTENEPTSKYEKKKAPSDNYIKKPRPKDKNSFI